MTTTSYSSLSAFEKIFGHGQLIDASEPGVVADLQANRARIVRTVGLQFAHATATRLKQCRFAIAMPLVMRR